PWRHDLLSGFLARPQLGRPLGCSRKQRLSGRCLPDARSGYQVCPRRESPRERDDSGSTEWSGAQRRVAIMTTRPATRISRLTIFVAIVFLCTAGASGQERNPPAGIPANKINSPERVIGVIALGGTAERTREAGRLARQFPHLRVIVSGAETAPSLKQLGQGISRDRIQIETASRNTHENATNAV